MKDTDEGESGDSDDDGESTSHFSPPGPNTIPTETIPASAITPANPTSTNTTTHETNNETSTDVNNSSQPVGGHVQSLPSTDMPSQSSASSTVDMKALSGPSGWSNNQQTPVSVPAATTPAVNNITATSVPNQPSSTIDLKAIDMQGEKWQQSSQISKGTAESPSHDDERLTVVEGDESSQDVVQSQHQGQPQVSSQQQTQTPAPSQQLQQATASPTKDA